MLLRCAALCLVTASILSACTSDDAAPTTTTSGPVTTIAPSTTSVTIESTTTTNAPTVGSITPPEYQIVSRAPTDTGGDEVVVLLDPTSYDSLSDLDLFDIIAEVVELFPPVAILHIVDDPSAANAVTNPDASEAERAVLATHYLARLDGGFQITYLGPFVDSGTAVLGS